MHLWPGDWRAQLKCMNSRIRAINQQKKRGSRRVRGMNEVSEQEFWIFWGLIIVARVMGQKGNLWDKCEPEGEGHRIDYSKYMNEINHRDIRSVIPYLFADPTKQETDPWWQIAKLIDGFNFNRRQYICSSNVHVLDESMSAFCPQSRKTGNLPHLSHILRKPEPLGTEFKVLADTWTNILLHLEIQKGKAEMMNAKYVSTHKATAANVMRMSEYTKRTTNATAEGESCPVPAQTYLGDSWFTSIQAATELALRGDHYIGVLKTNHAGFPRKYLENTMKDWPAGSHLVMETKTVNNIGLLAIG